MRLEDMLNKIINRIEEEKRKSWILIDSEDLPEVKPIEVYKSMGKYELCKDLLVYLKKELKGE